MTDNKIGTFELVAEFFKEEGYEVDDQNPDIPSGFALDSPGTKFMSVTKNSSQHLAEIGIRDGKIEVYQGNTAILIVSPTSFDDLKEAVDAILNDPSTNAIKQLKILLGDILSEGGIE